MMDKEEILKTFGPTVIADSHVVYASGFHGTCYVDKDQLYPYPHIMCRLCFLLAQRFEDEDITVVIGPEKGGIILSQWSAFHLGGFTATDVHAIYAEKTRYEKDFFVRAAYEPFLNTKARVLVTEDVLTTGGSVKKVVELVRRYGAYVVGVAALCNRGNVSVSDLGDVPRLETLIQMSLQSWSEEECAANGPCAKGIPINISVGKGKEFLLRKNNS